MPATSRRFVRLSLIVTVLAIVLASLGSQHSSSRRSTTTTVDLYGLRGHPSANQQREAAAAYRAYRTYVVAAAQAFSSDAASMCSAGLAHDLVRARQSWRRAQMDYDRLRSRIADRSNTELTIDGLIANQPFYVGRNGLHAIEQDLFGSTGPQLADDCRHIAGDGVALTFGLSHTVATPSRIALDAVSLLTWMVERVIAQPQEVFAHTQSTDSDSVVHSVASWWSFERPLVVLVDARIIPLVDHAVTVLLIDQSRVGGPGTPDSQVSDASWSHLAHDAVHVATLMTRVASELYGFGAGRTYA